MPRRKPTPRSQSPNRKQPSDPPPTATSLGASSRRPYVPPMPEDRSNYIPREVSDRMVRRVVLFAGIPSLLGVSSFVVNYFLIVNNVVEISNSFTLIESLGLFGLGFVGISYGVLSASWESQPGSALGVGEFRQNLATLIQEWRDYNRQKRVAKQGKSSSDRDP